MTLVEMVTSVGCSTLVIAAIVIAGVALQRSFAAVEGYARTEADQLRVSDYISMDCRRSIAASVNAAGNSLTLTLPPYYNMSDTNKVANVPNNTNGTNYYGLGSATVTYAQSGSNFTRQVLIKDASNNTLANYTTAIATNVSSFTVSDSDLKNTVTCNIMFFPTFLRSPGNGSWTSGATAPTGSCNDGDWYVINTKATDSTTVGNVYFCSGGGYTLQQNVKATQVYCNTFLRNAIARQ